MGLEDFVERVEGSELVRGFYQKQVVEPKAQKEEIKKAATAHPGLFTEEQIKREDHLRPEGLEQLDISSRLATRAEFGNEGAEYVKALDDKKLKANVGSLRPVESADDTADKRHYMAHERVYEISQIIADASNGDAKAGEKLEKLEEKEIKDAKKRARDEVLGKLKEGGKNYLGISDEEVENWVSRVEALEESSIVNTLNQLKSDDPLGSAKYFMRRARDKFYKTFDEKDRDVEIANYVRKGIMELSKEGDERADEAIRYVKALAA